MTKGSQTEFAKHLQRMHDMEDYQQPTVDRLYRADFRHVDGKDCEQCERSELVERPERRNHRIIRVHYGTIASGNSVPKDATVRDTYAKDRELHVLCFEMEAAGMMNNLPCLVIRGICDYCDSHKNDNWHKYAALTAAAYARELLLVLRPQRVDTTTCRYHALLGWSGSA
jgi:nucleoside phosphorylase